jgi:hypothetical protein
MESYDPNRAIDPKEWNALDEGARHHFVERFHRWKRIEVPNLQTHAAIHVVVENQVALGSEIPVQKTLTRLMEEGLNRHDAIHAIGTVLAGIMFDLIELGVSGQDVNADYYRELEELTAESWLGSINEASEDEGRA